LFQQRQWKRESNPFFFVVPALSRDPYRVIYRLGDVVDTFGKGRWLMGWTAPYGIDVPE